jgi:GT2 family glycosyltransferase
MLSVIVVGWNCADDITACLESVVRHAPAGPLDVIYVDNASADDSAGKVRREFPAVRVIANDRNLGFQRANNQALAVARGDVLVLLNPDARVLPGTLDTLTTFLDTHAEVGAVSPRCLYPDGRLQWAMGPFPTLSIIRQWFWTTHPVLARVLRRSSPAAPAASMPETQEQPYAYGACFAVKRAVVDAVGPMDEGFFLSGGEVAWSREIQRRGWKTYYVAEAVIVHRESVARARRSWVSELDWIQAHRRLLYLYEGLPSGIAGDIIFSLHLTAVAVNRCASAAARVFGAANEAKRSTA